MIQSRSLHRAFFALLVLAAGICCSHAEPETSEPPFHIPTQYSIVVTLKAGAAPKALGIVSRIYVDGNKLRTEMETSVGKGTVIHRGDLLKTYALRDNLKEYNETPYNQTSNPFMGHYPVGEWKKLEPEVLNNVSMDRYQLTTGTSSSNMFTHIYWVNPATQMFMRLEISGPRGKGMYECSDYKPGAPSAELFEVPRDYTPIDKKKKKETVPLPESASV